MSRKTLIVIAASIAAAIIILGFTGLILWRRSQGDEDPARQNGTVTPAATSPAAAISDKTAVPAGNTGVRTSPDGKSYIVQPGTMEQTGIRDVPIITPDGSHMLTEQEKMDYNLPVEWQVKKTKKGNDIKLEVINKGSSQ